jgi:squalene-hopene/tetraprenyl-beta-curcumene cyclase
MFYLSGGARRPAGFGHEAAPTGVPGARAFGGAAFARYDELVSNNLRDDLIKVAGELRRYQRDDGSVDMGSYVSPPVVTGNLEGTYLAAQTWRESYARTADDRWLLPLSRAEKYFATQARTWMQAPPADIQQLNYALMGLLAAGVSSAEASVRKDGWAPAEAPVAAEPGAKPADAPPMSIHR